MRSTTRFTHTACHTRVLFRRPFMDVWVCVCMRGWGIWVGTLPFWPYLQLSVDGSGWLYVEGGGIGLDRDVSLECRQLPLHISKPSHDGGLNGLNGGTEESRRQNRSIKKEAFLPIFDVQEVQPQMPLHNHYSCHWKTDSGGRLFGVTENQVCGVAQLSDRFRRKSLPLT